MCLAGRFLMNAVPGNPEIKVPQKVLYNRPIDVIIAAFVARLLAAWMN